MLRLSEASLCQEAACTQCCQKLSLSQRGHCARVWLTTESKGSKDGSHIQRIGSRGSGCGREPRMQLRHGLSVFLESLAQLSVSKSGV